MQSDVMGCGWLDWRAVVCGGGAKEGGEKIDLNLKF
jgi:hypothetical protein